MIPKLITSVFWLIFLTGQIWAQPNQQCLVKGNIKGLKNQPVYFTFEGDTGSQTDTVIAVNDSFTYEVYAPTDSIINFSVNAGKSVFFWYEPGTVQITGSIDALDVLYVSGTPENDVLTLFRKQIEWVYPNRIETSLGKFIDNPQKRRATIDFITKHPANKTSVYLLFMLAVFNPTEAKKYNILFQDFSPKVRTSKVGKQLGELLGES